MANSRQHPLIFERPRTGLDGDRLGVEEGLHVGTSLRKAEERMEARILVSTDASAAARS